MPACERVSPPPSAIVEAVAVGLAAESVAVLSVALFVAEVLVAVR